MPRLQPISCKTSLLVLTSCLLLVSAAWGQGACPAGLPVTGNNCYFIAANGSDNNSGTSESSPWLHAPGMPNCSGVCAKVTPASGQGFVFRGGDTWHFGNASASPYSGGGWNLNASWGTDSSCIFEGIQTGCIYYGVDKNWYSGSYWTRPVLTGDNPTSTSAVASCAYQVAGSMWGNNTMILLGVATILDNFELTGMCSRDSTVTPGVTDVYIAYGGSGTSGSGMAFIDNEYIHGWTATAGAGSGNATGAGTIIGGGANGLQTLDHIVVDGSDSDPSSWMWGQYPSFYHFRDSIVRYTSDGVGQWCHDIHDNIFEHIQPIKGGGHTNILECNDDANGRPINQPQNTPNVVYNNIVRHSSSNVMLWFCPNTISEYWFNNLIYDSQGEGWSIAGPPTYGCSNSGGQFMFNNTLVDGTTGGWSQPCADPGQNTGGRYLTVFNEHLINTAWEPSGCAGYQGPTTVSMTDTQAETQGYLLSSGGSYTTTTCANDATKPCSPTSSSNSTVGSGTNEQAYCTALASFGGEYAIGTEAANACKYGTTNGCGYDLSTHAMKCPAYPLITRNMTGNWDSGAYQFSGLGSPLNLSGTIR